MGTLPLGLVRIPVVPGLNIVFMTSVQSHLLALNQNLANIFLKFQIVLRFIAHYFSYIWLKASEHFTPITFTFMVKKSSST